MLRFQRMCSGYWGIRAPKADRGYRQLTSSHFSWPGLFLGGYQNWEHINVLSSFTNSLQLPFFDSAEGREWPYKLFHDHFPRKLCGRAEARTLHPWIWQIRNLQSSLLHYWTLAGAQTHSDPSTEDKKSSALPMPLLVWVWPFTFCWFGVV